MEDLYLDEFLRFRTSIKKTAEQLSDKTRFEEREFLNIKEIATKSVKTQILNTYNAKVLDLKARTDISALLNSLEAIESTISDAFIVDMYNFQLKNLINIISKELDTIGKIIEMNK